MFANLFKSFIALVVVAVLSSAAIASAVKLNNASHARALARMQAPQVVVLPRATVIGQREPAIARHDGGRSTLLR